MSIHMLRPSVRGMSVGSSIVMVVRCVLQFKCRVVALEC